MLVVQGDEDGNANVEVTTAAIDRTCQMLPSSQLQYSMYEGVTHAPIMYAAHNQWRDWIADRFDGVELEKKCKTETVRSRRGADHTQKEQNWSILYG